MKIAYLIMYLWHTVGFGNSAMGGPSMTIVPMPSISVCEKVGAVAKQFADQQAVFEEGLFGRPSHGSKPANFACFEVEHTIPSAK